MKWVQSGRGAIFWGEVCESAFTLSSVQLGWVGCSSASFFPSQPSQMSPRESLRIVKALLGMEECYQLLLHLDATRTPWLLDLQTEEGGSQKMLRLLTASSQFHSEWGKFPIDWAKLTRWGVGTNSGSYWSGMGWCKEGTESCPPRAAHSNISPLRLLPGHPRPPKTPHYITGSWLPILRPR